MDVTELIHAGRLSEALDAATDLVKRAPSDPNARIRLFELLAVEGQFARARKHLEIVADQAPDMAEGIASYCGVLDAEGRRSQLFDTGVGDLDRITLTPVDVDRQLGTLRAVVTGDPAGFAYAAGDIEASAPPRAGTVDNRPFDHLRDGDDLLATVLEVISHGRYGWIPFSAVKRLSMDAPRHLRDLLWAPADLVLMDGSSVRAFLPVRYPGSERHADPAVRMGRATEWTDRSEPVRGLGQHVWLTSDDQWGLRDVRCVEFTT